jgi:hypothetical protein
MKQQGTNGARTPPTALPVAHAPLGAATDPMPGILGQMPVTRHALVAPASILGSAHRPGGGRLPFSTACVGRHAARRAKSQSVKQ